jgi:hypothetical protein
MEDIHDEVVLADGMNASRLADRAGRQSSEERMFFGGQVHVRDRDFRRIFIMDSNLLRELVDRVRTDRDVPQAQPGPGDVAVLDASGRCTRRRIFNQQEATLALAARVLALAGLPVPPRRV